jgi:hypothetical protein
MPDPHSFETPAAVLDLVHQSNLGA